MVGKVGGVRLSRAERRRLKRIGFWIGLVGSGLVVFVLYAGLAVYQFLVGSVGDYDGYLREQAKRRG